MKLKYLLIIIISGLLLTLTIRGAKGNPQPVDIKYKLDQATGAFELSPERGRYAHVATMVATGSYALSKTWGDVVYPDVGYYNGKFYSFFAPGISYIAVPFYVVGEHFNLAQVVTFSLAALVTILALLFIFKISKEILALPTWASLFAGLLYAFGSNAWSYSITLYQHQFTVLFILSGLYAVWRYRQSERNGWLWGLLVWLSFGLALFVDYPNGILYLPVIIYFFASSVHWSRTQSKVKLNIRSAFVYTSIAFIALIGLQALHNSNYYGSWKRLSGSLVDYKTIVERKLEDGSASSNQQIESIAEKKDNVVGFFSETRLPNSFGTLFFSRDRGLFLYWPIVLLALIAIAFSIKQITPELATLLGIIVADVFLYSSWGDPWGGWAFGPRYLIPSIAVFSIFVAKFASELRYSIWRRLLVLVFSLYCVAIALLGALTTNAVPPKIEADGLGMKYNFIYNWNLLQQGKSGSFIYNTYLSHSLSLKEYYMAIYVFVLLLFILVLFVLPRLRAKHDQP